MRGKYTIHDGRNVVLLPEEEQVGALVKFPTHLGHHPKYDEFAKSRLTDQKRRLMDELKKAGDKPHEVDAKASAGIGESLHDVSNDLFSMVEAFGRMSPGRKPDEINQFAQRLEATLVKEGSTRPTTSFASRTAPSTPTSRTSPRTSTTASRRAAALPVRRWSAAPSA